MKTGKSYSINLFVISETENWMKFQFNRENEFLKWIISEPSIFWFKEKIKSLTGALVWSNKKQ